MKFSTFHSLLTDSVLVFMFLAFFIFFVQFLGNLKFLNKVWTLLSYLLINLDMFYVNIGQLYQLQLSWSVFSVEDIIIIRNIK